MRKFLTTAALTAGLLLTMAGVAQANHVTGFDATCTTWSVSFAQFHEADTDIVVTVDGTEFPVAPIAGDRVETGTMPDGATADGVVTVGAHWNHNGTAVNGGSETFELSECTPTPTTPPPTTPPPTTPPPTHAPGCHADHSCHTRPPVPPNHTAFTGGPSLVIPVAAFCVLAVLGAALLVLRARSMKEV
jgi:hypothetical protein